MPTPDAEIVRIEGLAFAYGDLPIFRDLSLSIPRGKVVSILGGSGSGKSTLLKLIGAQLQPSAGTVKVEGKDVHALDTDALYKLRLEMGMMFQSSGLFTDLSVYENIALPDPRELRRARGAGAQPRADEAARGRPARRARHASGRPLRRDDAAASRWRARSRRTRSS